MNHNYYNIENYDKDICSNIYIITIENLNIIFNEIPYNKIYGPPPEFSYFKRIIEYIHDILLIFENNTYIINNYMLQIKTNHDIKIIINIIDDVITNELNNINLINNNKKFIKKICLFFNIIEKLYMIINFFHLKKSNIILNESTLRVMNTSQTRRFTNTSQTRRFTNKSQTRRFTNTSQTRRVTNTSQTRRVTNKSQTRRVTNKSQTMMPNRNLIYIESKRISIMKSYVSNYDFHEFVLNKGYLNLEYWSSAGKKWLYTYPKTYPFFWKKIGEEWYIRKFDKFFKIYEIFDQPVENISYFEAEAFSNYKNATLPTIHHINIMRDKSNYPSFIIGSAWEWTKSQNEDTHSFCFGGSRYNKIIIKNINDTIFIKKNAQHYFTSFRLIFNK